MSANPSRDWQLLLASTLVGTQRRPLLAADISVLAASDGSDAPGDSSLEADPALTVASLLAPCRRAGAVALQGEPIAPAPPETRPLASEHAQQLLALWAHDQAPVMGDRHVLLRLWLHAAAAAGCLAPVATLPALLTRATADTSLRSDTCAVIGARGAWLAALAPQWSWAVAGATSSAPQSHAGFAQVWHAGTVEQRIAALRQWSQVDPAVVNEWVQSSWDVDPAAERTANLAAVGQSASRELLDAALGDRSRGVRAAAVAILCQQPESPWAQRQAARLFAHVDFEGRWRRRSLAVRAFDDVDPAELTADGFVAVRGRSQQGALTAWLTSATSLRAWEVRFDLSPHALVQAAVRGNDAGELLSGWAAAAVSQDNSAWAHELVATHFSVVAGLLDDRTLIQAVVADPRHLSTVADVRSRPFDLGASRQLLAAVPLDGHTAGYLVQLLDAQTLPELEQRAAAGGPVSRPVRDLILALDLRRQIVAAFDLTEGVTS